MPSDHKDEGFAGTLRNLHLTDIIQMCCLSVTTLGIRVMKDEKEGEIIIRDGDIVHSQVGNITGEEAFYTIMCWKSGNFESIDVDPSSPKTIQRHYQFLIMEAARRMDEKDESREVGTREEKLRVMIVDDSSVMSRILTATFTAEGDIDVVGVARNGEEALEMIDAVKPDLITLDMNMPVMDGKSALKHIMIKTPCPVVIMSNVGSATQNTVMKFLELGAVDFMSKPVKNESILIQQEMIVKRLHRAAKGRINLFRRTQPPPVVPQDKKKAIGNVGFDSLVVVNAGAGAHSYVIHLLADICKEIDSGLIALQTLPPQLVHSLPDYYNQRCSYQVESVEERTKLVSNTCFLMSNGVPVNVETGAEGYFLLPGKSMNSITSNNDQFLTDLAEHYHGEIFMLLLSGAEIGQLEGLKRIRENSGTIIIQERDTCMIRDPLDIVSKEKMVDMEVKVNEMASLLKKMIQSSGD
ncbi:MAG: response regulator [Desulfobacteraceae bacterium]|nr:response regulator [Desulfobacteraceae bacterium]